MTAGHLLLFELRFLLILLFEIDFFFIGALLDVHFVKFLERPAFILSAFKLDNVFNSILPLRRRYLECGECLCLSVNCALCAPLVFGVDMSFGVLLWTCALEFWS